MHKKLHSRNNCQFSLQESSEMSLSIIGNEKNRTFFITILGEFFSEWTKKTAKMGKELGIEWMKEIPKLIKVRLSWVTFLKRHLSSHFLTFVQHDGMTFFKRSFTANWCLKISVENYSTMKKPLYEAPLLGMCMRRDYNKKTFSWAAIAATTYKQFRVCWKTWQTEKSFMGTSSPVNKK